MTLLRRVATRISCGVVRRASPGAKEWAEATAHEVEFIEGDWRALGWALGSVRILWQRRETAVLSPADVPESARQFAREILKRTALGCTVGFLVAIDFSLNIWGPHRFGDTVIEQLGEYLMLGGVLNMIVRFLVGRGKLSLHRDCPITIPEYRGELERQRDFHRGLWFWSGFVLLVAGMFLFSAGTVIAYPALREMAIFEGLFVLIPSGIGIPVNLRLVRECQRRIDG